MGVCAPWDEAAILRGSRVTLRQFVPDDAAEMLAALDESRERFSPWLRFPNRLRTVADCRDHIVRAQADWLLGDLYGFGVREAATDRLLGGVDLFRRERDAGGYSIGYWLRSSAEGRGCMSAAVRLVTRFAFERVGASRVEIMCDARNARSAAVAERLGFVREGALRNLNRAPDGTLATMLVFARVPTDPADGLADAD
jgi:RimJ/RimL family protein N-acetyltransferase